MNDDHDAMGDKAVPVLAAPSITPDSATPNMGTTSTPPTERIIEPPAPATESNGPEGANISRNRSGSFSALAIAAIVAGIVGLSAWYLTRPTPLMIQGEAG